MARTHPAWSRATNTRDLGTLTADWIEGHLGGGHPSYPHTAPDPETRHLIPTLAAANRAGYVTTNSQPGLRDKRSRIRQRAAVEGYITDPTLFDRIAQTASRARLYILAEPPTGSRNNGVAGTEKQTALGLWKECTWWGVGGGRHERIEDDWDGTSTEARHYVRKALLVTLIDPEWERDDRLWTALANAVR